MELAGHEGSFILLAADGAGKSTVMRHLHLAEPASTEVNLPALDKAGIRHELQHALAMGGPVYLDAMDVAAHHLPDLFVLQDCLTEPQAAGVPWRLACRPAVWDGELAAALSSRLPAFRHLRLLPVTGRTWMAFADCPASWGSSGVCAGCASSWAGRLARSPLWSGASSPGAS